MKMRRQNVGDRILNQQTSAINNWKSFLRSQIFVAHTTNSVGLHYCTVLSDASKPSLLRVKAPNGMKLDW